MGECSMDEVREQRESPARQYDLKRRAQALGWTAEQLIIIDEDLGLSGASAAQRSGFQRMVAERGLGRARVVRRLDVPRLAPNPPPSPPLPHLSPPSLPPLPT